MTLYRLMAVLVFSLMLVLSGLAGVAPSGSLRPADAASGVAVKVQCDGNPEVTRVTNNRSSAVKIKSVGSVYKPRSNEPFRVDRRLATGKTIAFETGYDANSNTLTRQYIYNSDVGNREGTRVKPPSALSWIAASRGGSRTVLAVVWSESKI